MNLAELRKKAQKQKEEITVPVTSPPEFDMVQEREIYEIAADPLPEGIAADSLPEPVVDPVALLRPTEAAPVQAAREVQLFDPLSVLLAGREAAAVADEAAFTDVEASADVDTEEFHEFLCFRVASETYAINIMNIKEIIKPREVTEVPRAPSFVSGVLSLRGIIIPIFNMRLRLGLAGEKSAKERIIVLKRAEEFFGVLVDEVIQVVKIASSTIEKPPVVLEGIDRDFVQGIGRFQGQMLILLNQEKILDLSLA